MGGIDPLFDTVEAWKNGPVIPSVYYSFKHYNAMAIATKSSGKYYPYNELEVEIPTLKDMDIKDVADFVWGRYKNYSDIELVDMLHRKGTPWFLCYKEGKNNIIPDLYTKAFYKKLIRLWKAKTQKTLTSKPMLLK